MPLDVEATIGSMDNSYNQQNRSISYKNRGSQRLAHEYYILYQILMEIEDLDLRKNILNVALIKSHHESLHRLHTKYPPVKSASSTSCLSKSYQQQLFLKNLHELIERKCLMTLESMTGDEIISSGDLTKSSKTKWNQEMNEKFMFELQNLQSASERMTQMNQRISLNSVKMNDSVQEYQELLSKYTKEYKLSFKLKFDVTYTNYLCSEIQTLSMTKRRNETRIILEKYGSEVKVSEAEEKRRKLESLSQELDQKITSAKGIMAKFDRMNPDLLAEYKKIRRRYLDMKEAKALFENDTTTSFSSGSELNTSGPFL